MLAHILDYLPSDPRTWECCLELLADLPGNF